MHTIAKSILVAIFSTSLSVVAVADESPKLNGEYFLKADANADKKLDHEEFKTLIDLQAEDDIGKSRKVKKFKKYDKAFKKMDVDGDGFISKEDLMALKANKAAEEK